SPRRKMIIAKKIATFLPAEPPRPEPEPPARSTGPVCGLNASFSAPASGRGAGVNGESGAVAGGKVKSAREEIGAWVENGEGGGVPKREADGFGAGVSTGAGAGAGAENRSVIGGGNAAGGVSAGAGAGTANDSGPRSGGALRFAFSRLSILSSVGSTGALNAG